MELTNLVVVPLELDPRGGRRVRVRRGEVVEVPDADGAVGITIFLKTFLCLKVFLVKPEGPVSP